jgi:ornithine cyclodeaminase
MRFIDAAELRQRLPWPALIAALRQAFIDGGEVPARHVHTIGAGLSVGTSLLMPAWQAGGCYGVKVVNIFPGNSARGLPGLHGVYALFDACTGVPLAVLDGSELTARRTAAASALATGILARPDASRLLLLGCGRVATLLPAALRAVRPDLRQITVWNHRPAGALALAAQLRGQGWDAEASEDLSVSVRSADIISCATLSTTALVQGAWLQPGTHLDLIGSFTPQMREADADCFRRARVFFDTDEAGNKAGDVLSAIAEGGFDARQLQGTLAELCRGATGRRDRREITLFKSVGTALEDLAAAVLAAGDAAAQRPDNPAHPSAA